MESESLTEALEKEPSELVALASFGRNERELGSLTWWRSKESSSEEFSVSWFTVKEAIWGASGERKQEIREKEKETAIQ